MYHAWGIINAHKILAGNVKGKGSVRRRGCRWENDIKMDHKEIGCEGVNWIYLAQAGSCEHGNEPSDASSLMTEIVRSSETLAHRQGIHVATTQIIYVHIAVKTSNLME
jgi:hypothetical protein